MRLALPAAALAERMGAQWTKLARARAARTRSKIPPLALESRSTAPPLMTSPCMAPPCRVPHGTLPLPARPMAGTARRRWASASASAPRRWAAAAPTVAEPRVQCRGVEGNDRRRGGRRRAHVCLARLRAQGWMSICRGLLEGFAALRPPGAGRPVLGPRQGPGQVPCPGPGQRSLLGRPGEGGSYISLYFKHLSLSLYIYTYLYTSKCICSCQAHLCRPAATLHSPWQSRQTPW